MEGWRESCRDVRNAKKGAFCYRLKVKSMHFNFTHARNVICLDINGIHFSDVAKTPILKAPNRKARLCFHQQLAGVREERVAIVRGGDSSPERTRVQRTQMV